MDRVRETQEHTMPDPNDPRGSTPEPAQQPPRAEQPTDRVEPTPVHPTTPLPAAETPAHQPQPAAETPHPAAAPTPEPAPAAAPTAPGPTTTASAAEAPVGPPPPPTEAAGPAYATAPPPRRRFRQVAAHRATQLVAVGVLGLIIGGGVVALLDHDGYGRGHGRPGISRMDQRGAPPHAPGPRGPGGWGNHGRFER